MTPAEQQRAQVLAGIQFKVLAQVFPVLRHDALKPLSNAKLTIVLLEKSIAKGTILDPAAPPFVSDLDGMLDESVETIRLLNTWFQDEGRRAGVHEILSECRKLAFSQLLLSGKKVQLDASSHAASVSQRAARYVLMAWMIHAIQALPQRGILDIRLAAPGRIEAAIQQAPAEPNGREPRPDTSPPLSMAEVELVAQCYGWQVRRNEEGWTISLPTEDPPPPAQSGNHS
ncbi:hypothetical protein CAL29_05425 [Bordetella genomosp. 10]|uniref:Uncharacterized protein n=1 Tax=Bordetella genomosp. 10 TaxID=1416804 RepID=A0A261SK57_9BORD|nr:hypothetical protein [Bordetella genomosp. 10]OZI37818.1 hypothetical protein CAL29_05425 [Bordetella genomosp. 10]